MFGSVQRLSTLLPGEARSAAVDGWEAGFSLQVIAIEVFVCLRGLRDGQCTGFWDCVRGIDGSVGLQGLLGWCGRAVLAFAAGSPNAISAT